MDQCSEWNSVIGAGCRLAAGHAGNCSFDGPPAANTRFSAPSTDVYRDTDHRYRTDPAFYSAVRTLEAIAREHGFTPGELKQIAFKAALNIEETRGFGYHQGLGR